MQFVFSAAYTKFLTLFFHIPGYGANKIASLEPPPHHLEIEPVTELSVSGRRNPSPKAET